MQIQVCVVSQALSAVSVFGIRWRFTTLKTNNVLSSAEFSVSLSEDTEPLAGHVN